MKKSALILLCLACLHSRVLSAAEIRCASTSLEQDGVELYRLAIVNAGELDPEALKENIEKYLRKLIAEAVSSRSVVIILAEDLYGAAGGISAAISRLEQDDGKLAVIARRAGQPPDEAKCLLFEGRIADYANRMRQPEGEARQVLDALETDAARKAFLELRHIPEFLERFRSVTPDLRCPLCFGGFTGVCPECHGCGVLACAACHGTLRIRTAQCRDCGGAGVVLVQRRIGIMQPVGPQIAGTSLKKDICRGCGGDRYVLRPCTACKPTFFLTDGVLEQSPPSCAALSGLGRTNCSACLPVLFLKDRPLLFLEARRCVSLDDVIAARMRFGRRGSSGERRAPEDFESAIAAFQKQCCIDYGRQLKPEDFVLRPGFMPCLSCLGSGKKLPATTPSKPKP